MNGAFEKAGSRDHLLNELSVATDESTMPLVIKGPPADEALARFEEQTGLSPAFVLLTRAVHEGDHAFLAQLITIIPEGADTGVMPLRWLAGVWRDIGRHHHNEALTQAAEGVLRLHEQADGSASLAEWRSARSVFRSLPADVAVAGNVMAAAAWNPRRVAGGIADVVYAWHDYVRLRTETEVGWTADHAEQERAHQEAIMAEAHAIAGPAGETVEWYNSDEGRAWEERFLASLSTLQEQRPPSLPDLHTAWTRAREELAADMKRLLLDAASR